MRTERMCFVAVLLALFAVGCDKEEPGDVVNNYYVTASPDPDPAPLPEAGADIDIEPEAGEDATVEVDAGADAEVGPEAEVDSGCTRTLKLIERAAYDDGDIWPGTMGVFLAFTAQVECSDPSCCIDVEIRRLTLDIHDEDGNFDYPNVIFHDARIIAEDLSVASGPDQSLENQDTGVVRASVADPIGVQWYAMGRTLRLAIDVAGSEPAPGTLYGNRYRTTIAYADTFEPNVQVEIEHYVGDNSVHIYQPSADYCEPSLFDPQGGFRGCCGDFERSHPGELKAGDLIKPDTDRPVFYFGSDGKRYIFPTSIELDSWYASLDMMSVPVHNSGIVVCNQVLELTETELASIPIGAQIVTKRPGAYITGITSSPQRFVVDTHRTLRLASPQVLELIYPGTVAERTYLTGDAFFASYQVGTDVNTSDDFIWLLKYPSADLEVELGIHP